jgi:fructose-1,6-bisphosphatase/inositol monophosphatase family enzyme
VIEIRRADEIADFTGHLGEIDGIFLNPALDVIFVARKKSNLFVKCRSDDILQNIETASSLLLMTPGASDISQAASKIRQNLLISMMFRIFGTLKIFAKITLHIFILI